METCSTCGSELRLQHEPMLDRKLICPNERCPKSIFHASWKGKAELVRRQPGLRQHVFGGTQTQKS